MQDIMVCEEVDTSQSSNLKTPFCAKHNSVIDAYMDTTCMQYENCSACPCCLKNSKS